MTTHKKGPSDTQPLGTDNARLSRLDQATCLFRMNGTPDQINVFQSPFRIRLAFQVGIVINRLDFWEILQPRIKCSPRQAQTVGSLFCCKHSLLLTHWTTLFDSIPLDMLYVKNYNTSRLIGLSRRMTTLLFENYCKCKRSSRQVVGEDVSP